jgi:7-cyano-7-deazaguanine reductase
MNPTQRPEDSLLGKHVSYRDTYAPELLFPIPRASKRADSGLAEEHPLPFHGEDLWNAYELSWLDPRGKPVVALAQFHVPASSPCLIESKSLKLYLNSFNQHKFPNPAQLQATIAQDLSRTAGAPVVVRITPLNEQPAREIGYPKGVLLDTLEIEVDRYTPAPEFLQVENAAPLVEETLYSHLLKSNCLVTGQPDWGMVAIRYCGGKIERAGLLRYIVSFRQHNEFHEQCVERIFMDIMRQCAPEKLDVLARYTRRGGLDINPWRSNDPAAASAPNLGEVRQ